MKTNLFYFTGTGNSLKVANDLSKELGETKVYSIAKVINNEIDLSADCIGIVYPVYVFGMPLIVRRFIKKLKKENSKYFFSIATYGGTLANTLGQNAKEMKAQGLLLSAGFGIKMPDNYTPMFKTPSLDEQTAMFNKEKERIKEIAKIVKERKVLKVEKSLFIVNWFFSGVIYNLFSKFIPGMDKSFQADKNCNGCQICSQVCPVKNIIMKDNRPEFLHQCEQCFACFHWCPQQSIQYGNKTQGKLRYRNPEVKLENIRKND